MSETKDKIERLEWVVDFRQPSMFSVFRYNTMTWLKILAQVVFVYGILTYDSRSFLVLSIIFTK